jgi:glycosyltransferase involved in cell wall biosynthesis
MRILFFIDSFPAGGKERRLVELMKGLRTQQGYSFELVIMTRDVHYKEIFDLCDKVHFVVRKTKKDFSVFGQFHRICKAFDPDIVHCWDSMTAVYLLPLRLLHRFKLVNGMVADTPTVTGFKNKNWLRGKLTFPFSHAIVGNSLAGLAAYGAPAGKRHCIYNGFSFSRTEKLADPLQVRAQLGIETSLVVGMVASFSKFKDYPVYYKAALRLLSERKDVTFLAVGDHTDSEASRALVPDEWKPHFRFLGRRSDAESLISCMDVCVLATFTEGISNAIMEYMAMQKPVVATDGGGTKEIVSDGETGYLVKAGDPEELAGKIRLLLNDPVKRTEMGAAGEQRVKQQFLLTTMVGKYVHLYSSLTGIKKQNAE